MVNSAGPDADVIVIGGGAMGSAAAWQLAGRGPDVLLLERFEPGHTRGASHGASRIFRLSYPDPVHIWPVRPGSCGETWSRPPVPPC